jgi:hypothetical protein
MKKNIYSLFIAVLFASANLNAQLTFSFGAMPCWTAGGSTTSAFVTSMPSGATSFSWTVVGSSTTCGTSYTNSASNGSFVSIGLGTCCGMYTVTCSAYNSSSAFLASTTNTLNMLCPSWLTFTTTVPSGSSPFLCAGSQGTAVAQGGVNYTWIPGSISGSIAILSPTASMCYTLMSTHSSGCTLATTACFSVAPAPSPTISASSTVVCAGNPVTLACMGGGVSYTWTSAGPPPINTTGANVVIAPTATSLYSVTVSNGTCTSTSSIPIIVNPIPTLALNLIPNPSTVCPGGSATLAVGGANSYSWSNGPTTSTIVVSPTVSTCYSVTGYFTSTGCSTVTSICVSVQPTPTLAISPSTTVCLGSSATLTVSGAMSYSWNSGSMGGSVSVLPLVTTTYIVVGQHSSFNCTGYDQTIVFVDTTCSQVWPGDANSDGVVDNTDVFEIGLAFNATGAARTPTSNTYASYYANNWLGTVSSGKNKCHADCDGDGTVNNNDTLAIYNNFNLTHTFRPSENSSPNADISLVVTQNFVAEGVWSKADIILGSSSSPINNLYGVAFDLNFDNSVIQTNDVYISYTSSFLNASNQNVVFRKAIFGSGKVYAASVRVNGSNVSGNGKIGEFWFRTKTGLPTNSSLNLSVSNAKKINNTGSSSALSSGGASLNLAVSPVGIGTNTLDQSVRFFPNPASGQITLQSNPGVTVSYHIYDITGRKITNGEFTSAKTLDVSTFESGSYIIRFDTNGSMLYKKLVIEK